MESPSSSPVPTPEQLAPHHLPLSRALRRLDKFDRGRLAESRVEDVRAAADAEYQAALSAWRAGSIRLADD